MLDKAYKGPADAGSSINDSKDNILGQFIISNQPNGDTPDQADNVLKNVKSSGKYSCDTKVKTSMTDRDSLIEHHQ